MIWCTSTGTKKTKLVFNSTSKEMTWAARTWWRHGWKSSRTLPYWQKKWSNCVTSSSVLPRRCETRPNPSRTSDRLQARLPGFIEIIGFSPVCGSDSIIWSMSQGARRHPSWLIWWFIWIHKMLKIRWFRCSRLPQKFQSYHSSIQTKRSSG